MEILGKLPFAGDATELISLCRMVDRFQEINYSKKRTVTSAIVEVHLRSHGYLAPVETDPIRRESLGPTAANTPVSSVASRG